MELIFQSKIITMTTQEIADRFYVLAQEGKFDEIQDELYAQDVKSIEPEGSPWPAVQGMEAIKEKSVQFNEMVEEMYSGFTDKPIVSGNTFACRMGFDAKMKGRERGMMEEIALYQVKDGKIVSEQFFM
ncbi:nuclear transport factor 2 family protein [Arachidicoccus soli]|uniref:Nuclear transport factor 2 family protein n=2 Tax=Arachidicoccus soli TaxID=2341117 RepID=A0A386HR77_9BACT|nr:nuclear transport factor 2 family protein [Arachidicoccus soli]